MKVSIYVLFLFLMGCSVGPAYKAPEIEVPSEWKHQLDQKCEGYEVDDNGELVYLDYWWQVFDDQKLDELESLALQNNRTLFIAYERIKESRDLMGLAASRFYPQLTLNPLTTNTVQLIKNYINPNATSAIGTTSSSGGGMLDPLSTLLASLTAVRSTPFRIHEMLYLFPLNVSYEVDLWGKIRDQYRSTFYSWLAMKRDYDAVMLSLTSNLATAYYQLRAADAQLELLAKIIKTREKSLEINRARYEEQISFYADVTLAAEELETVILQQEDVKRQRDILEDQIAVLAGLPASIFQLDFMPLRDPPPCIPEGIPSEVLLRRPDIAEAEDNAKSQHFLVKEAYTHFYPSLVLTAAGGFESPVLRDFLQWISRYWTDSVQVSQLVFDGGYTYYNFLLQIARFKEASGAYQQQVLAAFQEVEDSLTNINAFAKQHESARRTSEWAQKTNQLYSIRYQAGVIYYIDVVNTERDLLNYQINVNTLLGLQYVSTIQLIKALGGGWAVLDCQ